MVGGGSEVAFPDSKRKKEKKKKKGVILSASRFTVGRITE
jgi:hypothetical protein